MTYLLSDDRQHRAWEYYIPKLDTLSVIEVEL